MRSRSQKSIRERAAFTIVELTIVLLIVANLTAIAAGRFVAWSRDASLNSTIRSIHEVEDAVNFYLYKFNDWPATGSSLGDFLQASTFQRPHPFAASNTARIYWSSYLSGGVRKSRIYLTECYPKDALRLDQTIDDGDPLRGTMRYFTYSGDKAFIVYYLAGAPTVGIW